MAGGWFAMECDDPELTDWRDAWCKWCGDRLPEERDPRRLFCVGRECRAAYQNDLRRERLEKARAGKICQQCGATFTPQVSHAKFCCHPCARTYHNRRRYTKSA